MKYYKTDEKEVDGLTGKEIEELYDDGYVLTRIGKLQQTRSLRIDLSVFEPSSENRRVLRKAEELEMLSFDLPLPDNSTNWKVHSLGKVFYKEKFDDAGFSANKIRELLLTKQNKFNKLFVFYQNNQLPNNVAAESIDHSKTLGYVICYMTESILHYCYPFYDLMNSGSFPIGMAMMLEAIIWAKEQNLKYIYLGSFTRPADRYKLQFKGLEWFDSAIRKEKDGQLWSKDLDKLKTLA
ncbi:hypothetical protein JW978_03855 [Candidatus Dojkabacteria bacterium]|nr:hypothetical protein [Candidatus Dojkabacteria bacterium]